MNVHEKFYGQAMQEITSGAPKRHDLWAKAVALSIGDQEAAHAIYLELVARHLSEASLKAERQEMKDTAVFIARQAGEQGKIIGFKALCWGVWAALAFLIYLGVDNWTHKLYEQYVYERTINAAPGQGDHQQEQLTDYEGRKFTEPTEKEYYQAYMARYMGINIPNLPKAAVDTAEAKYYNYTPESGSILASAYWRAQILFDHLASLANPDYFAAIRADFWQWLLQGVFFLGALAFLTWKMRVIYRRGYFYKTAS